MPSRSGAAGRPPSTQVLQVLLSLHHGPNHGYAIIKDIDERTGGKVRLTASTLYDALARLLDQRLIEEMDPPRDERDSRRRYYAITALGRRVTSDEIARLDDLLHSARALQRPRKGPARG